MSERLIRVVLDVFLQNEKLREALAELQEHHRKLKQEFNGMSTVLKETRNQLNASKEKVHDHLVRRF